MVKYIGLGLLAAKLLMNSSSKIADNLIFDFDPIKREDLKLLNSKLSLRFSVTNRNSIDLRIKSITGTLSHNDFLIAPINTRSEITLPAGESKPLRLEILLNNTSVLEHLTNLLINGGILQPLIFKGKVSANGVTVNFKKEIPLLK